MKRTQSGSSLVGTLIAAAIIAFAFVVYFADPFNWMGRQDGAGKAEDQVGTLVGDALDQARGAECQQQLKQLRIKIAEIKASTSEFPMGIQETSLNGNFYNCPVGSEDYNYDSDAGSVTCVHAGHEKF